MDFLNVGKYIPNMDITLQDLVDLQSRHCILFACVVDQKLYAQLCIIPPPGEPSKKLNEENKKDELFVMNASDALHLYFNRIDHGDDSSLSGQRENDEVLGSGTEQDKLSKRDFCIKKVPQAVKMKKGRKAAIDTSASEVINTNNIARRTRRRKV